MHDYLRCHLSALYQAPLHQWKWFKIESQLKVVHESIQSPPVSLASDASTCFWQCLQEVKVQGHSTEGLLTVCEALHSCPRNALIELHYLFTLLKAPQERGLSRVSCLVDAEDPAADYEVVRQELAMYNPQYCARPHVVALNKMDLADAAELHREIAQDILSVARRMQVTHPRGDDH